MADLNDLTRNVNIWDDSKSKSVTITTDSAKERLDVDIGSTGTVTSIPAVPGLPTQVSYNKSESAVNSGEWQEFANYTVPSGYDYAVTSFRVSSEWATETARVAIEVDAGVFTCSTDSFADDSAFTAPQFGSGIIAHVTTQIGAGVDDTLTITYVNEIGTTGRTTTVVFTKSDPVGTTKEPVLQGDDLGVRDITNVTHSATSQAGVVALHIYYEIFNLLMTTSDTQYQAESIAGTTVIIPDGTTIIMAVLAGTAVTKTRHLSLFGTLRAA